MPMHSIPLPGNKSLLKKIPEASILTPHPKEFERLFGKSKDEFERIELAKAQALQLRSIIVLKGHHSVITQDKAVQGKQKQSSMLPAMPEWQPVEAAMY